MDSCAQLAEFLSRRQILGFKQIQVRGSVLGGDRWRGRWDTVQIGDIVTVNEGVHVQETYRTVCLPQFHRMDRLE